MPPSPRLRKRCIGCSCGRHERSRSRDYLQARYGDFVLYDPPLNTRTGYIWLVPVGLGLLALFVLYRLQRSARGEHHGLDAEQQKRLQRIVGGKIDTQN